VSHRMPIYSVLGGDANFLVLGGVGERDQTQESARRTSIKRKGKDPLIQIRRDIFNIDQSPEERIPRWGSG